MKHYRVVCVRPEFLEPGNLPDEGVRGRIDAVSNAGMVRDTGRDAKRVELDRSEELQNAEHVGTRSAGAVGRGAALAFR